MKSTGTTNSENNLNLPIALRKEIKSCAKLIEELKVSSITPMKLCCDNKDVINIAYNPVQRDVNQNVELNYQFNNEKLQTLVICMPVVPTDRQLVYILTNGLPRKSFENHKS